VHGLVETERAWRFGATRRHGDPTVDYGSLLRRDLGHTPLCVRYDTGLRISGNGSELVALLERLLVVWPVPVTDVELLRDTRTHGPLHDGARHFAVVATVLGSHDSRAGSLLGDLLVRPHSAAGDTGREDRLAFPDTHVVRLAGLHHFDLLNHPRVYRHLRTWLADLAPGADARDRSVVG
jgi:hypothetical protein